MLEETGYEKRQTSMIKTTVLQFMFNSPWKCTILCFLLANCYGINYCNVFIGQYNQNDRNSFERCALSGPQKHITKESDGFHNHSTQLTMIELKLCMESCVSRIYVTCGMEYVWKSSLWMGIFQRATQQARILLTDNIKSRGSCSVNYC